MKDTDFFNVNYFFGSFPNYKVPLLLKNVKIELVLYDIYLKITANGGGSCDWTGTSKWACCSSSNQCGVDEGDCDSDADCSGILKCGNNNCGSNFHSLADCCYDPSPGS